jgi:septum formation inhibitor MinC
MAHKMINELEWKLMPFPDFQKEQLPKKPRLSMKILHEQLRELQNENLLLAGRVNELEQQIIAHVLFREETASTADPPVGLEHFSSEKESMQPVIPGTIVVPRSERHSIQKKKSFWPFGIFNGFYLT